MAYPSQSKSDSTVSFFNRDSKPYLISLRPFHVKLILQIIQIECTVYVYVYLL